MKMNLRRLLIGALLCLTASVSQAAVIYTVETNMPGGVPTLQAERGNWSSGLGSLMTEGFEGLFTASNSIDFGSFIVSISGSSLATYSGANASTRTEGNQSLGFSGSALLTFTFTNNVSAFGIDWSSLEGTRSTINYFDSAGNNYSDLFDSPDSVTAGFFGISGVNLSSLTFDINSIETLEFDFVQFEIADARPVPTPHVLSLMLFAVAILCMRKKSN